MATILNFPKSASYPHNMDGQRAMLIEEGSQLQLEMLKLIKKILEQTPHMAGH